MKNQDFVINVAIDPNLIVNIAFQALLIIVDLMAVVHYMNIHLVEIIPTAEATVHHLDDVIQIVEANINNPIKIEYIYDHVMIFTKYL
jgi:hypothetical protein